MEELRTQLNAVANDIKFFELRNFGNAGSEERKNAVNKMKTYSSLSNTQQKKLQGCKTFAEKDLKTTINKARAELKALEKKIQKLENEQRSLQEMKAVETDTNKWINDPKAMKKLQQARENSDAIRAIKNKEEQDRISEQEEAIEKEMIAKALAAYLAAHEEIVCYCNNANKNKQSKLSVDARTARWVSRLVETGANFYDNTFFIHTVLDALKYPDSALEMLNSMTRQFDSAEGVDKLWKAALGILAIEQAANSEQVSKVRGFTEWLCDDDIQLITIFVKRNDKKGVQREEEIIVVPDRQTDPRTLVSRKLLNEIESVLAKNPLEVQYFEPEWFHD